MNLWLRALGAKIGRGVWCETYWLPEADLVTLEEGATVNRGCVVQTHLFHDRIMRMDTVVLERGATLGPHCVALPAARIGAGATVGPASLVMRGDEVPASTRWQGNPIAPWNPSRKKRWQTSSSPKPKKPRPRDGTQRSAGKKRAPPVIDPYLPADGNFGYRVSRYELELEYKVAINRLVRLGDDHRRHAGRAEDLHPRPVPCAPGDQGDRERQAARAVPDLGGQAAHHTGRPAARRGRR